MRKARRMSRESRMRAHRSDAIRNAPGRSVRQPGGVTRKVGGGPAADPRMDQVREARQRRVNRARAEARERSRQYPATRKQMTIIGSKRLKEMGVRKLTSGEASDIIKEQIADRKRKATP